MPIYYTDLFLVVSKELEPSNKLTKTTTAHFIFDNYQEYHKLDIVVIIDAEIGFHKSLLGQTAHCAWTNADEAVADAYTTTPSLLSTGAKKLFDS